MTDTATIEELALAADFPDVAAAQWRDLVEKVLKGADFERRLVRTTADGIKVQPLYVAADAPAVPGLPGSAPYVRGASAAGSVAGGWDIRQLETVQDPAVANAAILEALEGGATSIQLRLQARPTQRCWIVCSPTCSSTWLRSVSTPRPNSWPRPRRCCSWQRAVASMPPRFTPT